ncbi:MAG: hypothetical protein JWQ72_3851 [Polaromonas sp.]|nr:hypothetical protein [Polaromonas sp.]
MNTTSTGRLRRLAMLGLLAAPLLAMSQTFPTKPIRMVVPYAPGGAVDAFARPIAQKMSDFLGQPVIIDNRPGANSTLGADNVVRSPADGYTILMTSVVNSLVPFFSKNVPYDPAKDFTPIAHLSTTPNILAVHPSVPVHSVQELVDYAKKNPNKLFYGTTGVGSTHHLGGVMLAQMAGISFEHVPYKGGSPTINDALGGQIPVVILTAPTILPFAKQGKLRPLGVIEGKRYKSTGDIPSIGETIPGYAVPELWLGVLGPPGMPHNVVERLNAALRQAVNAPDVKQRLEGAGFEITGNTSAEDFATSITTDTARFRKIVVSAGIKPE